MHVAYSRHAGAQGISLNGSVKLFIHHPSSSSLYRRAWAGVGGCCGAAQALAAKGKLSRCSQARSGTVSWELSPREETGNSGPTMEPTVESIPESALELGLSCGWSWGRRAIMMTVVMMTKKNNQPVGNSTLEELAFLVVGKSSANDTEEPGAAGPLRNSFPKSYLMIIIVAENGRRTGKTLSLAVVSALVGGGSESSAALAHEVSGTIGVLRRKKKENRLIRLRALIL
ncbi:hypothetical protein EDB80DRAFT_279037 [Ilyonectria destructans]|nr:hypothetical protein EDB80DRAFT_279037 [Ilyonectria destructans]